jgi:hypothetical protein
MLQYGPECWEVTDEEVRRVRREERGTADIHTITKNC